MQVPGQHDCFSASPRHEQLTIEHHIRSSYARAECSSSHKLRPNWEGSAIMMNRRQFVGSTAAAALLAGMPSAFAATYDLVIKGGRVIDPSMGLDATRDIAISGGRIAAIEPSIAADAAETIDARGKLVTAGLIDIHTHAGRSKEGPPMCLQDGVTGWVDAGSGGADNMDAVAAVARGAPQLGRCLVNIARTGV